MKPTPQERAKHDEQMRQLAAGREVEDLLRRINVPLVGRHWNITVHVSKGGLAKTTDTVVLGSLISAHSSVNPVALGADPDRGTLHEAFPPPRFDLCITDLDKEIVRRENAGSSVQGREVEQFIRRASLHPNYRARNFGAVVASRDAQKREEFGGDNYRRVLGELSKHYNLTLTDTGNSTQASVMAAVLDMTDLLVIPSSTNPKDYYATMDTIDWLRHSTPRHQQLAQEAIVVVLDKQVPDADPEAMAHNFRSKCHQAYTIPHDPHLYADAIIDIDKLAPGTRLAFLRVCAEIMDVLAK